MKMRIELPKGYYLRKSDSCWALFDDNNNCVFECETFESGYQMFLAQVNDGLNNVFPIVNVSSQIVLEL